MESDFDKIEKVGSRIKQFFKSQSYVISANDVDESMSESLEARRNTFECDTTTIDNLLAAQKRINNIIQNASAFESLLKVARPHNVSYDEYREFYNSLIEFNDETVSKFHERCSCKLRE